MDAETLRDLFRYFGPIDVRRMFSGAGIFVDGVMIALVARLLLDWQPSGSWLLALPALVLGTICFASLGLLMAGTLRAETTLALANGLYLLFLLVGGLVLPIEILPGWLHPLANLVPAHALDEAVTSALVGGRVLEPLIPLLLWTIVFLLGAIRFFRWE